LPYLNEDFKISADGKTITYEGNNLALYGYNTAAVGQFPVKGDEHLE